MDAVEVRIFVITKFDPYDYISHMLIPLHLIRDSSSGLLSPVELKFLLFSNFAFSRV
jgi:hypothetical protein